MISSCYLSHSGREKARRHQKLDIGEKRSLVLLDSRKSLSGPPQNMAFLINKDRLAKHVAFIQTSLYSVTEV
ncbi:hypothetical protein CEXT_760461 [Caerostris extrusa]|uniref:Uncharacterized protein n=1 Tax=Caerostris extrusa TaxID=172846 RepID=A0AAV4Q6B6_CAEEX|nr:hypothetical protein CEXT_760461 [Caerostris extrusa]